MFASTSYLLQSENNFIKNVDKVLSSSRDKFSIEQADSTLELLIRIAKIESDISAEQYELIDSVTKILKPLETQQGEW